MTTGIKVSYPGKSIDSTTPEDFVLNSEYGSVKIYKQNDNETYSTVTVGASTYADVTITHNLGFAPMTMLYVETTPGSGRWFMGISFSPNEDTYITADGTYTYVDDTYFKFRIYNRISSQRIVKYYYYILGNTAQ